MRGGRRGDVRGSTVNLLSSAIHSKGWQWFEVELHLERSAMLSFPFEVFLCVQPEEGQDEALRGGSIDLERFRAKVGECMGSISKKVLMDLMDQK